MSNFNLLYKISTCPSGHKTWARKKSINGRIPLASNIASTDCQHCLEDKNKEADKKLIAKNCKTAPRWKKWGNAQEA